MNFKKRFVSTMLVSAMGISSAFALTVQEAKEKFPGTPVQSVTPLKEFPGVYEMIVGKNNVFYLNKDGSKMMIGHIFDVATQADLTQQRIEELSVMDFAELPKQNAIKIVKGNGAREFAVFSDPDCPFCKRLDAALEQLDNYTLYLYPTPLLKGLGAAGSPAVATERIWCSADKAKAWLDYTLRGIAPTSEGKCVNPSKGNMDLARTYGISGTPALIGADGSVRSGFMEAGPLNQWLDQHGKAKK